MDKLLRKDLVSMRRAFQDILKTRLVSETERLCIVDIINKLYAVCGPNKLPF